MSDQGDYLRKVQPGEKLQRIQREAYNAFVDAAVAHRRTNASGEGRPTWNHEPGIVTVRNSSGADVDRFGILEVSGALIEPEDNEVEWTREVALDGTTPSDSEAPFCVLLEPLANGALGKAVISGACWVWVEMGCESHLACGPQEGNDEALVSSNSGPARILYVEPGEANEARRAYVLLGSSVDGCNANGCGSPAWTRCRKRVIDVRCTAAGIEYDAEFDYYDCNGRLLFTSDVPCASEGDGGGGPPTNVTLTLDGVAPDEPDGCPDCDTVNGALVLTPVDGGGWELSEFDWDATVCGSTGVEVTLSWIPASSEWRLSFFVEGSEMARYSATSVDEDWDGTGSVDFTGGEWSAAGCTGWPPSLTITPAP